MKSIMEVLFNSSYLIGVITVGLIMVMKSGKKFKLFGLMAILLGTGDAFHLLPRSYALLTTGLEANALG